MTADNKYDLCDFQTTWDIPQKRSDTNTILLSDTREFI